MLFFDIFGTSLVLENIGRGIGSLREGSKGRAVALIQGGLVALGFKQPKSTAKKGAPDGIFGHETHLAIVAFQKKNELPQTGVVDKATLLVMDTQLSVIAQPLKPPPAYYVPPISTGEYKLGTSDPPLGTDPGAGKWNSTPKRATIVSLGAAITLTFPGAYYKIGDDAFMGEFHRQGLAREFDCSGSFKRHLTWTQGSKIAKAQLYPTGAI